jgi:hypothetical protein
VDNKFPKRRRVLNQEIGETGGDTREHSRRRRETELHTTRSQTFFLREDAYKLGFLGRKEPDLSNIYDLSILNGILKDKGLKEINVESGQTAVK